MLYTLALSPGMNRSRCWSWLRRPNVAGRKRHVQPLQSREMPLPVFNRCLEKWAGLPVIPRATVLIYKINILLYYIVFLI